MESVNQNDVLCGRGGATNNHIGNRNFRKLVAQHQQAYLMARKRDKRDIAQRIVSIVRNNGGRFLKRNDNSPEMWVDVGDKRACEKTSQALREGLEVRRNGLFEKGPVIPKDTAPKDNQANQANQNSPENLVSKASSMSSSVDPIQLPTTSNLINTNTTENLTTSTSSMVPNIEATKKSDVHNDSKVIVAELESKGAAVVPV